MTPWRYQTLITATHYIIMMTYAVIKSSFYLKSLMTPPLAQHHTLSSLSKVIPVFAWSLGVEVWKAHRKFLETRLNWSLSDRGRYSRILHKISQGRVWAMATFELRQSFQISVLWSKIKYILSFLEIFKCVHVFHYLKICLNS